MWYVSTHANQSISTVTWVSDRPYYEIKKLYPQIAYEGNTQEGMQRYSFYERDSAAKIMFDFKNNFCQREVICPRGNKNMERYVHYFNVIGMEFIQGGGKMIDENNPNVVSARIISGQWRFADDGKIENIFMEAGEINSKGTPTDAYFLIIKDTIPPWLK